MSIFELLDDYDPVPGLVARGVMFNDHDPQSCEAACCRRRSVQCLCGRFAKYVSELHYYDGNFDQYSYTVLCSKCGEVTIECV